MQSQATMGGSDVTKESSSLLSNWQPKGRLINTLISPNYNNFPDPVTTIVASSDSRVLISGTKNGLLHYYHIEKGGSELKIECSETMFISDQGKPNQINCLSIINEENTFVVGMDSGTLDIYAPHSTQDSNIGLLHRINKPEEGNITKTWDFKTDFSSENVFVYSTQKGYAHIHDIRVKLDVATHDLGMKYGIPSALITSNIQSTNKLLIGTLGGFIHMYDVRYNIPMVIYEHSQNHPILDLCMYYPNKRYNYKMLCESTELDFEHWLVSTGGIMNPHNTKSGTPLSMHEVSMLDIYSGEMKATFTVDDTFNEAIEPVEIPEFYAHDPIKLNKTSWNSKFLHTLNEVYKANYASKIICPKLLGSKESVPYFISASADRKIRYWSVVKDERFNWYNISTPTDNECKYMDFYLGDAQSVQEKVYNNMVDSVNVNTTVSYYKKRKAALSTKSNLDPINAENEVMYPQERGISSCQPFNACQFSTIKNSTDIFGKNFQNSGHSDAILDLAMIEIEERGPYIVSAGRDGLIKIWN